MGLKNKKPFLYNKSNLVAVIALLVVFVALCFIPVVYTTYIIYVATLAILYAMLTASYDLLFGYTGQLSFAQAAFFGLGAYCTGILTVNLGINFWLSLPLTVIFSVIMAVIIGSPALRLRGAYFAVTTFFLAHFIYLVFLNSRDITNGPLGFRGITRPEPLGPINFQSDVVYYYLVLLAAVLVLILLYVICHRSELGRRFIAIHEDQDLAESLGINTAFYKVLSFSISSGIAGFTGALFAHFFLLLHPQQFAWFQSEMVVIMTIVGGAGTLIGPVIGAAVVTFVLEFFRYAPEFRFVIWAIALIVILIIEPKGLIGIAKRIGGSIGKIRRAS